MQVDLITNNSAALPATKNTKTSFCEAEPRLNKLFRWIATYVPAPPKDADTIEARYVKELAAKCESNPDALRVSREEPVFQKIGLKAKVDLFVGCVNGVTIYEAKAGKTKALDLYQLRMYVDGCALDNKPVDEAILIARYHPPEVRELLRQERKQELPKLHCRKLLKYPRLKVCLRRLRLPFQHRKRYR